MPKDRDSEKSDPSSGKPVPAERASAAAERSPSRKLRLSTVTPVYRGENYLEDLVRRLESVREGLERGDYPLRLIESIFVVDDAPDGSEKLLERLAEEREWVHVVVLSTNFGQHAATAAGLLHASGDWIATLDEDGQHPPEVLPELVDAAARRRQDLAYAAPISGPHASGFRDLSSRLAKEGIAWLVGNPKLRHFNSFRVGRGTLLRAAAALVGPGVYLDIALSWFTRRVIAKEVDLVDPRADESGYSILGLFAHAWRLLKSSDVRPLRLGFAIGLLGMLTGVAGILGTIYLRIFEPAEIALQGWASLLVTILFFGGLSSFLAGYTLEYIISVHQAGLGRPAYATVDRSSDRLILEADPPCSS